MMYATVSEMASRYPRSQLDLLTASRSEDAKPDDAIIEGAITDASALIESYISARYTLPLSVVPVALARQCCVIAWYFLNETRATEQTGQRYRDAIKWLGEVRDGKIPLGVDEAGTAPVSEDLAQVASDPAVFSRKQRGFI